MRKSLLNHYKVGDQINDLEFKRVGTILSVTDKSIKVKFPFSTYKLIIHKVSAIADFVKKRPLFH